MSQKTIKEIWRKRESGIETPDGTVTSLDYNNSQSYLQIKQKAIAIENLYKGSNISLNPASDLYRLISDAKKLSDYWLLGQKDKCTMNLLFQSMLLDRIAEASLPLFNLKNRDHYLKFLLSGSLDLLDRKESSAKDILWELELWSILKSRSFNVNLEEPDIVVDFSGAKIGIACKKIYSEKHVQNILSKAVAQIEGSFDFGIVAINLDDTTPANQLLREQSFKTLTDRISNINANFIDKHERHFRKYLSSGRAISILVSTWVLSDVFGAKVRFNNARQSTMWTIPGLSFEKDKQLKNFYELLMK